MTETIRRENLAEIDFSDSVTNQELPNIPPGEVLGEEFMRPLGLSARRLAREIGVPPNRITAILAGSRVITAETALRLADRLGTTAEFWLHLQIAFDLETARRARRDRVSGHLTI